MTVKKIKDMWFCHIDRQGMPRVRRKFKTEKEARLFERDYLAQHASKAVIEVVDKRTVSELATLWFKYHGINLSDGERRLRCLVSIANDLKNPAACLLTAEAFVEFRYAKLQSGIEPKTINNHHGYLSSMFERLIKLKVIDFVNPLKSVDFIKIHERQLSYLSHSQIALLLDTISDSCQNKSTWYVTQLCLRTGARWGEAEQLRFKQLRDGRVTFEFTKSKRTRTVPLDVDFYNKLVLFALGKNPDERIFTNCIGAFRRAVKRSEIDLPTGQCSHILRHSFASHFIMNGGNILSLQKILGHADISMTMRYAHLAPDHLSDAVKFNPVAVIGGLLPPK